LPVDKINHSVWITDATGHTVCQFFYNTYKFACDYHPDAEKNAEEIVRKLSHYDELLEVLEEMVVCAPSTNKCGPATLKAREAIAKAKGEL